MHFVPERRRRIQADCAWRLGTSVVCHLDTGNASHERNVHGTYYRRG